MTDLNDFFYEDGTDDVLAAYVNNLLAATMRAEYKNTETITGTKTLLDADTPFQILTPSGSDQDVELPAEANTNHVMVIYNPSGSSYDLVVKDDSGSTTYATLSAGQYAICIPMTGVAWLVLPTFLDEDDMASDSSTAYPSQQSVKAYVDARAASKTFKNMLINGDMLISQRGTSETGVTTSGYKKAPDRYSLVLNNLGTWTVEQSTDAPDGFASSYKITCTTANASPAASAFFSFNQLLEGQNLQHLKKGTANAESVSLSFRVKSNKTGSYIFELSDVDNSRMLCTSFTIDSADTWETKEIVVPGDTVGALDNDNANSLTVKIWLAAGSNFTSGTLQTTWGPITNANRAVGQTNLADTVSNYIAFAGMQLEVGDAATSFENLPYDIVLQRCQRYFERHYASSSNEMLHRCYQAAGANIGFTHNWAVPKRANPTVTKNGTWTVNNCGQPAVSGGNVSGYSIYATATATADTYFVGNTGCYIDGDAEL